MLSQECKCLHMFLLFETAYLVPKGFLERKNFLYQKKKIYSSTHHHSRHFLSQHDHALVIFIHHRSKLRNAIHRIDFVRSNFSHLAPCLLPIDSSYPRSQMNYIRHRFQTALRIAPEISYRYFFFERLLSIVPFTEP